MQLYEHLISHLYCYSATAVVNDLVTASTSLNSTSYWDKLPIGNYVFCLLYQPLNGILTLPIIMMF